MGDNNSIDELASSPAWIRARMESTPKTLTLDEARQYVDAGKVLSEDMKCRDESGEGIRATGYQYLLYWARHLSLEQVKPLDEEDAKAFFLAEIDPFWVEAGGIKSVDQNFSNLMQAAQTDGHYFQVTKYFCAFCISRGIELPAQVKPVAAAIMAGTFAGPVERKISRMRDHGRNNIIFFDTEFLTVRGFKISSAGRVGMSAIALVAEVWTMSEENVKRIYYSGTKTLGSWQERYPMKFED